MKAQIAVLREVFIEWLKMHRLDHDFFICTQQEWKARGEQVLEDADLVIAFENQLISILEFGPFEIEEELQELAGGFGYYFEIGNNWNIGFYPLDNWPPLPQAGASYQDLLKDERWQSKCKRILRRSRYRCEDCGQSDVSLHIHHTYYRYGRQPWQYPDGALLALCDECHKQRDDVELRWRLFMPQLSSHEVETIRVMLRHSLYWFDRRQLFEFLQAIEKCPYAHIPSAITPEQLADLLIRVLATKGHPDERGDQHSHF